MRTTGKITHWKREKGYGFITPASGAKQVFVHVSDFQRRGVNPKVGQLVTFSLSNDQQGRPCAVRVALAGEKSIADPSRKSRGTILCAIVALAAVLLAAVLGMLPVIIGWLFPIASMITFLFYYFDKTAAQSDRWRISEGTLHGLSLLGGWPGAMIGQQVFRHKTSKKSFRATFWTTVVVNVLVTLALMTETGRSVLQAILAG